MNAGGSAPLLPLRILPLIVYCLGAAFFLGRFLLQLGRIIVLAYRSKHSEIAGTRVKLTAHPSAPFSFFRWIFVNPGRHDGQELDEILLHERTHVREWHSLDVVFFELLRIAFWFNPFVYLMKTSAHQNLEYLADKDVIRSGSDRRQYQYRLLQLSFQQPLYGITNHFSKSQLKNRIVMMNKKQTPRRSTLKYIFILPILFTVLLFSNAEAKVAMPSGAEQYASQTGAPKPPATVTGTVKNSHGVPVRGVSIIIQGTNKGTVSDANGRFTITTDGQPAGQAIIFSKMGMQSEKAAITPGKPLDMVMQESNTPIREITVSATPQRNNAPAAELDEPVSPDNNSNNHAMTATAAPPEDDDFFIIVEDMPKFQGGNLDQFRRWVSSKIQYPDEAQKKKIQGTVVISFIIEKDGSVTIDKILESPDPLLDQEIIRVVSSSPKWEPGRQRDEAVRVKFTLPINFALN